MSRPLTNSDVTDLGLSLSSALGGVLETAGDVFFDRPEFIRSDEPRNQLSSAVRAISRYNCRVWARADKSNYSTRVNAGNAELCNPYLEEIGEKPPDGGFSDNRPFNGGQCDNVWYLVSATETNASGITSPSSLTQIRGKITPGSISSTNPARAGNGVYATGSKSPFVTNTYSVPTYIGPSTAANPAIVPSLNLTVLGRADGQPDECGDLPSDPQIEPPGTPVLPPLSPPDAVSLPGFGDLPFTIDLNPEGDPTISFPDIGLDIPLRIGGDDGGSTGSSDGVPVAPPPPEVGSPEELEEGESGGELGEPVPPVAPTGQVYRCIGYDWFIEEFPGGFSRVPGTDRVTPQVIGNLQLKLLIGEDIVKGDNVRLYSSEGVVTTPDDSLRVVGVWWSKNPLLPLRLTPIFKLFKEEQEQISEV